MENGFTPVFTISLSDLQNSTFKDLCSKITEKPQKDPFKVRALKMSWKI